MVEHVSIPDNQRHEPRGASSASSGQVLSSVGGGATAFTNPSNLDNITVASNLTNGSMNNQNPGGTDAPYQISFGGTATGTDAEIASSGVITINNNGLYLVTFEFTMGKTTDAGVSILISRILVNGSQEGPSRAVQIDNASDMTPVRHTLFRPFEAGNTLVAEFFRSSNGSDNGGLRTIEATVSGWSDVPSAWVGIQRIEGGF